MLEVLEQGLWAGMHRSGWPAGSVPVPQGCGMQLARGALRVLKHSTSVAFTQDLGIIGMNCGLPLTHVIKGFWCWDQYVMGSSAITK